MEIAVKGGELFGVGGGGPPQDQAIAQVPDESFLNRIFAST
jgi:hypothetical protein